MCDVITSTCQRKRMIKRTHSNDNLGEFLVINYFGSKIIRFGHKTSFEYYLRNMSKVKGYCWDLVQK